MNFKNICLCGQYFSHTISYNGVGKAERRGNQEMEEKLGALFMDGMSLETYLMIRY